MTIEEQIKKHTADDGTLTIGKYDHDILRALLEERELIARVEERERIRDIIESKDYRVYSDPSEYIELFDVLANAVDEALTTPLEEKDLDPLPSGRVRKQRDV